MINPNIFREYDIRGIVADDFSDEVVELLGKAFGTFIKRQNALHISAGRDVRLSSEHLKNTFVQGVLSTGVNVTDIGEVPTPIQYFSIVQLKLDGGVMITGSHNPIEYNGFKMSQGLSSIFGAQIKILKELIDKNDFENGTGQLHTYDIVPEYIEAIKSRLSFKRPLKVVIDAGNGTGGIIPPKIWEALGLTVSRLYCEPDGSFPNHLPDPTVPKYVVDLQKKVLAENADLGIGYDGDSDRIGTIDDKGRMIYADRLLALFSRDVLANHPNAQIVFDVKCSQALPEYIEKYGGRPVMYKTGHSLLKAKMKELHAPLAGEMSGHMFFADDYFGFDDAIYASGRLMQMLAAQDRPLSDLADEIPPFVSTPEIRIECADEEKFSVVQQLVDYFKSKYDAIDIDGVRALFGDGWGLVRASNTQPVLVLRFEAKTASRLIEIIEIFKEQLNKYPAVKFNDKDFDF